jgi:SAM-dependent methyltransferase
MDTKKYYNENAKEFFETTVNIKMKELYERFLNYMPSSGKILDLGCGSGRDLVHFFNLGYEVLGVDNSVELVNLAKEFSKLKVLQLDFHNLDFDNEFEGIWACATLLHVKRDDLNEILKKSLIALKKNGIMYMSFKYGDFEGVRNGRYFNDLNENLLNEELKKLDNVELIETWITQDKRPNRKEEWLNVIIRKK